MEINVTSIIIGVLCGVSIAFLLIYLYVRGLVRGVLGELQEQLQKVEDTMLPVVVERHNGMIFCYEEEGKQFICQGATLTDIKDAIKARFPNRVAFLAGGDTEVVRELREQLVKDKVEGILAIADENSISK